MFEVLVNGNCVYCTRYASDAVDRAVEFETLDPRSTVHLYDRETREMSPITESMRDQVAMAWATAMGFEPY